MIQTNIKKHDAKIKRLEKKIAEIVKRNPTINFYDLPMLNDLDTHRKLTKELVIAKVDAKGCRDQKFKCSDCICRGK